MPTRFEMGPQIDSQLHCEVIRPISGTYFKRVKMIGLWSVQNMVSDTSSWIIPQGNPFLLGHFEVWLPLWDHQGACLCWLLMSRFGHHISSLHLRFFNGGSTELLVHLFLGLLRMNLPNLKILRIKGFV